MDFRQILMVAATQGGGLAGPDIAPLFKISLRTGTGAAANITGIPFSPDLYFGKSRSDVSDWWMYDTARGVQQDIAPNQAAAETTQAEGVTAFNANGVSIGTLAKLNTAASTYMDIFLKKASGFFDEVLYTGNATNRTVAHALGEAPGFMIVRRYTGTTAWFVWHRSLTDATRRLLWNQTAAQTVDATAWNSTAPTSSVFSLGTATGVNASGDSCMALLFPHNDLVQCGSFTVSGGGAASVTGLPFQPQATFVKRIDSTGNWFWWDTTRGWGPSSTANLATNLTSAENSADYGAPTADGFTVTAGALADGTYIYVAFRS